MTSPIKILRWDSRFFGRRIARVQNTHLTQALIRRAIKASTQQRVDCLYLLASSKDPSSARCAEAHGFHLVDIRITLNKELSPSDSFPRGSPLHDVTYRSARPADIRPLQRLARNMFLNSRFALDPGFPTAAHMKLFAVWISKSVRGSWDDWVGLVEYHGRLAGFVTCRKVGPASGTIGLIGVGGAFRRRGIGRGLLNQGEAWFHRHHVRHISVVTQGRAVDAQRLYQENGFRTSQVDLWYHKWF